MVKFVFPPEISRAVWDICVLIMTAVPLLSCSYRVTLRMRKRLPPRSPTGHQG